MPARGQCPVDGDRRRAVLEFLARWSRDRAHPFRWTFTGYPLQAGPEMSPAVAAQETLAMATRNSVPSPRPPPHAAGALAQAIHALGDYAQVSARAERGI